MEDDDGEALAEAETAAPSWWDDWADPQPRTSRVEPPEISPSHYQILGEQGRGGLGRVLRARDLRTGRVVAIKEILRGSDQALRRFRREALVTANLQHPAIVPVYEVGRWPDGQPFYAMKLVDGVPLSSAIRNAADTTARLALLPHVVNVADALGYAHAQGWIHRDLKPGNVLVGAFGETVVIDWGLAKRIAALEESGDDSLPTELDGATLDGQVLGTPVYMPPEQARGEKVDARADVYAIGALLYHVLAGVTPYHDARNTAEVIARVTAGPPRPLAEAAPGLPADLYTIVARAMAHAASDRYPSARELADDLARFRAGNLVAAHSYTAWELVRRWLARHRTAVAVGVAAAIALAVVGVVSFRQNLAARRRAEAEGRRATRAQAVAEDNEREAQAKAAALQAERGLEELTAGSPARALPYLADAYRRAPGDDLIRMLAGRALESLTQLELGVDSDAVVDFRFAGSRAMTVSEGHTPVIDLAAMRVVSDLSAPYGALSPDGAWLVARPDDAHELARLDAATGEVRALRPLGDGDAAAGLDVDDRGRIIAVGSDGAIAVMHDDLVPVATARIPFAPAQVTITHDGRVLAGGRDGQVWAWDAASSRVIVDQPGAHPHGDPVTRLCASRDGVTWMTMSGHATLLWQDRLVVARQDREGVGLSASDCAIDDAGLRAVTSVDANAVELWDLHAPPSHVVVRDTRTSGATEREVIAMTRDGKLIAIGDHRGQLDVIDADTRVSLGGFVAHDAPIAAVAFAPDGRHLLSATVGGDVRVWQPRRTAPVVSVAMGERGFAAWFATADRVIAAGSDGARIVAAATGEVIAELRGHRDAVVWTEASADVIATASRDGTARLWRSDGTAIATLDGGGGRVRRVSLSRDGSRVLTVALGGSLAVWNTRDGSLIRRIAAPGPLFTARLSPDGHRIASVLDGESGPPTATLWDADGGAAIAELPMPGAQPVDAAFTPDGDLVAFASSSMLAPVFDGRTGAPRFRVKHEAPVLAITWSRDGKLLASSDLAGRIHLTRRDGERLRTLRLDHGIAAIALDPRAALVAAATDDGLVHLLEASAGREVVRLVVPSFPNQLGFSPDGQRLAIDGTEPAIRIWKLPRYDGTADELDRRVRCAVPYRLDADGLDTAPLDPAACLATAPPTPGSGRSP